MIKYLLLSHMLSSALAACASVTLPTSTLSSATTNHTTPFCSHPYTESVWMANSVETNIDVTSLLLLDSNAEIIYQKMLRRLAAFDCSKPYSLNTCGQCRDYYRTWVCLVTMPQCTKYDESSEIRKPCLDTCNNVLRACPYNLKFSCPESKSLFVHDYSIDNDTCNAGRKYLTNSSD